MTTNIVNLWDAMDQDQLLLLHQNMKEELSRLKAKELELRKYIVDKAFPDKHEGMNTLELGNGYSLKAGVKFNYKLLDNKTVESTLDKVTKIGNQGAFIAERLVSWTPNFLLTEYRELQKSSDEGSDEAKEILKTVNEMLVIDNAAPTLSIVEPKAKK